MKAKTEHQLNGGLGIGTVESPRLELQGRGQPHWRARSRACWGLFSHEFLIDGRGEKGGFVTYCNRFYMFNPSETTIQGQFRSFLKKITNDLKVLQDLYVCRLTNRVSFLHFLYPQWWKYEENSVKSFIKIKTLRTIPVFSLKYTSCTNKMLKCLHLECYLQCVAQLGRSRPPPLCLPRHSLLIRESSFWFHDRFDNQGCWWESTRSKLIIWAWTTKGTKVLIN